MTDLSTLNEQQYNAIMESIDHNIVLVAGAGAGKTSTLVKRIQYLVDDMQIKPENIMAITFTNKAAGEIRERVAAVSNDAGKMWIGTFHSICVRLLRMFGKYMGINNFSIIDGDDSKKIIRKILKDRGIEYTPYEINAIKSKISSYKNNLVRPADVLANPNEMKIVSETYQEYQNICWRRKTFDFDDLIIYGLMLLTSYKEVINWVHSNIKYLIVDETQDSNSAQFLLIQYIGGNNNIFMVGDSNQSIYGFRNAKPEYMENFAFKHPNTKIMKLEKNYRSTKTIINAANEVIKNNNFGTKLTMFCDKDEGEKIFLKDVLDAKDEARWIASEILMGNLGEYKDIAIIYRANHQSRILEQEFNACGIPYMIFGSQSFFNRKEVKDLFAFIKIYTNYNDVESFSRVIGTLKGVGEKTLEKIINIYMSESSVNNLYEALVYFVTNAKITNYIKNELETVIKFMYSDYKKCSDIIQGIYSCTSYRNNIAAIMTDEAQEKLSLMDEFENTFIALEEKGASMNEAIDQISLLTDTKGTDKEKANSVKFMTAHASKGLEFKTVFVIGMEDGMFPHANAVHENTQEAIEEERRLFYVAMTRAKKKLYLTRARQKYGKDEGYSPCIPSRFLDEIPKQYTYEAF